MSTTGLDVFDHRLRTTNTWLDEISDRIGPDRKLTERSYGSFKRQLTLPADVNPDAIEAKYAKGVLKLTMKKDEKAQSRVKRIAIG